MIIRHRLPIALVASLLMLTTRSVGQYVHAWETVAGPWPRAVVAADSLHCAAVVHLDNGNGTLVRISADAGRSWTTALRLGNGVWNADLAYVPPGMIIVRGMATDGRAMLAITRDGGVTVDVDTLPIPAKHVAGLRMFDTLQGLFVRESRPRSIYRTTDGGRSWSPEALPDELPILLQACALSPLDLVFRCSRADASQVLARSTDGGVTWSMSPAIPTSTSRMFFLDVKRGWLLGTVYTGGCSRHWAIFRTTDGGETFASSILPWERGTLTTVSFADSNQGLVGGNRARTYRTTDGGKQWLTEQWDLLDIAFVHPTWAIAVSGVGLVRCDSAIELELPRVVAPDKALPGPASFRWTAISNAEKYQFVVDTSAIPGLPPQCDTVLADTMVDFDPSDFSLQAGRSYYARVRVLVGDQWSRWSETYTVEAWDGKYFTLTSFVRPELTETPPDVDFEWIPVFGATTYRFELVDVTDYGYLLDTLVTGTALGIRGLTPGHQYRADVRPEGKPILDDIGRAIRFTVVAPASVVAERSGMGAVRAFWSSGDDDQLTLECTGLAGTRLRAELYTILGTLAGTWEQQLAGASREIVAMPARVPTGAYFLRWSCGIATGVVRVMIGTRH